MKRRWMRIRGQWRRNQMYRVRVVLFCVLGGGDVVWACWNVERHAPIPSCVRGDAVGRSHLVQLAVFVPVCCARGWACGVVQSGALEEVGARVCP